MAGRQNTKRFSIQAYDNRHYQQTEAYTHAVESLFDTATKAISDAAAKGNYDPGKAFSFDDYPSVKKTMQDVTNQLAGRLQTTIETGSKNQWLFACDKNDAFIASIMDTSKLSKASLDRMQDRNLDALSAFQTRKVAGLNLSQRVWKYVDQYREQIEDALDVGLGEGRSAQQLARDVKRNLNEPDRLFRRVRDKRGNLVLSRNARAYNPGRGVYRSSVRNAQRLARSEINMAYRESDYQRWQTLDFVVGFEILRSNHKPLCDCKVCARFVGQYPKSFKFKGWHPQCMCYAIPILADEETFDENELGDLKAALKGTSYTHKAARNTVIDVPDGFKAWVRENAARQKKWGSTPYFVLDNFVDGKLSAGLNFKAVTVAEQVAVTVGKPTAKKSRSAAEKKDILNRAAEREKLKKELKGNLEDVAKALKAVVGKEMNFTDANELRGNPEYQEQFILDANGAYQDKQGNKYSKNPLYKRKFTVNCQSCVVANELRRRGLDVRAKGRGGKGTKTNELAYQTEKAWLDENGNIPVSNKVTGISVSAVVADLKNRLTAVGRYHIKWTWKNKNYGHIITCEKLWDGTIRFYDPQNGKVISDIEEYFANISTVRGIQFLRVDNLRLNIDMAAGVVQKPAKPKKKK